MTRRCAFASLIAVVALAGCSDSGQIVAPEESIPEPAAAPSFSQLDPTAFGLSAAELGLDSFELPERHLVVFRSSGRVPTGFAAAVKAAGGSVDLMLDRVGAAIVSGLDDSAAVGLRGVAGVQSVDLEPMFALPEVSGLETEAWGSGLANHTNPAAAFFFPRQWHLRAIDADDAWASGSFGSSSVTVAILDSGIGYTHFDLGDVASGGRVDLARSASFIPLDDAVVEALFPGAHPIADLHFHGTHVASTVSSGAFIAAGVTSQTTLMGVRVCSAFGGCPFGAIMAGLLHAADNDADIANLSLGGAFAKRVRTRRRGDHDIQPSPSAVAIVNRLFNYINSQGMTVIVSAGNEALDLDHTPNLYKTFCDAPSVICVSATGPTASAGTNGPWANIDALASYSNFGRSAIDVAAPGGNAGGAVWAACSTFSLIFTVCQANGFTLGTGGTSMAAPHAAGVAALLVANGTTRPSQIQAQLQKTADDLGPRGVDPAYGKGRVNALRAAQN